MMASGQTVADRLGQPFEAIAHHDADVLGAAVLDLGQHPHPEFRPLTIAVSPAHSPSTSRVPSTVTPSAT